MASLQAWANSVIDEYYNHVARLLGLSGAQKATIIIGDPATMVDDKGNIIPASTSRTTITINPAWFKEHNGDVDATGALIHEMVHSVQQVPSGTFGADDPTIEAMADAMRYKLHQVPPGWQLSPEAQKFVDMKPWQFQAASTVAASGTPKASQIIDNIANGSVTHDMWTNATSGSGSGRYDYLGVGALGDTTTAPAGAKPTTPPADGFEWVKQSDGTWIQQQKGGGTGDKQREKNNAATFTNLISTYGLEQSDNTDALIQKAASHGWNSARFLQELYKLPEFHDAFPGIFSPDGSLKMTPAQYLAQKKQYQATAAQAGLNVGDNKLAWLFKNDVSAAEFQTRATAISRIRDNADMFKAFGQQLKAEGIGPQGGLSKQDLFKFVLGEGNKEWYQSWNNTVSLYYGQQAGLAFGGNTPNKSYTSLGAGVNEKIAGKGLGEGDLAQGYKALAHDLTTTLPLSRIQKLGLSKQDLVELEFGGKRQAAVAQRVQQILANEGNIESAPKAALGSLNIGSRGTTSNDRAQV